MRSSVVGPDPKVRRLSRTVAPASNTPAASMEMNANVLRDLH
jgi:hypothetical protein